MLSFILESKPYSETFLTGISSYISCNLILKIEKGEGQESEESRIIYTLAPLDKKLITSDKKRYSLEFNGNSYLIVTVSFLCTQHAYNLLVRAHNVIKIKTQIYNLMWPIDNLLCCFKMMLTPTIQNIQHFYSIKNVRL